MTKLSDDDLERLAMHSAFGLLLVTKWMAGRDDVDPQIRERLRGHVSAIEGVLVARGHDWIKDELEATEAALGQ
ncbi:hypothetical protein [Phenylobacterium soli]|uniref:Uncharacterized protein n=1 Tax=Phenylobacterium soli TaxID=2170551 RepID=A0A328AHT9_9CAUL|nr:hypothetical protein [Phenylobacterium soli]RAK54372.1 hypothetical protein DJ017_07475 [Phenylobacterium soli]